MYLMVSWTATWADYNCDAGEFVGCSGPGGDPVLLCPQSSGRWSRRKAARAERRDRTRRSPAEMTSTSMTTRSALGQVSTGGRTEPGQGGLRGEKLTKRLRVREKDRAQKVTECVVRGLKRWGTDEWEGKTYCLTCCLQELCCFNLNHFKHFSKMQSVISRKHSKAPLSHN